MSQAEPLQGIKQLPQARPHHIMSSQTVLSWELCNSSLHLEDVNSISKLILISGCIDSNVSFFRALRPDRVPDQFDHAQPQQGMA